MWGILLFLLVVVLAAVYYNKQNQYSTSSVTGFGSPYLTPMTVSI